MLAVATDDICTYYERHGDGPPVVFVDGAIRPPLRGVTRHTSRDADTSTPVTSAPETDRGADC